jgi:hypothetical protein
MLLKISRQSFDVRDAMLTVFSSLPPESVAQCHVGYVRESGLRYHVGARAFRS